MKLTMYQYAKCGTCVKAKKFLNSNDLEYKLVPIREKTPTLKELKKMLGKYEGNIKKLLNTSGKDYRELGLKDKVQEMSDGDVLKLLKENGNLIKRPFIISDDFMFCGFKEEEWKKLI